MSPPNPYVGRSLRAYDNETHLIQPGLLAPPLVCSSFAWFTSQPDEVDRILHDREGGLGVLRALLLSSEIIAGQNLVYDFGVACAADPTLVPLVFDKLERGGCYDTMVAEMLIQIYKGTLGQGTSSSGSGGLSLADLAKKYLGVDRSAAKGEDAWRVRYHELDGVPLEQWPEAAVVYPLDDAEDTLRVAALQIADGRNLHDMPAQLRAHWALHLSAMWGVRTDKAWVEGFTKKVTAEHERTRAYFLAKGLLKVNRCTKDQEPDNIDPAALNDVLTAEYAERDPSGRYLLLERALKDLQSGRRLRYGTDKKALEARVMAAYNGEPPRSPKDNIKTNKDTLIESGDALLDEFAKAQENEKYFSTYLPILASGTTVPINPRYTVLVDTGRASCSKPNLMNIPRGGKGGNPREGYIARPGTVWSSNDFPALEMRTLAAVCEFLGIPSELAKAFRKNVDPHIQLGASIASVPLETFLLWKKGEDKYPQMFKDLRQMAKGPNFGLPGGLGPAKLVVFARSAYGDQGRFCLLAGRATTCGEVMHTHKDKKGRKTLVCAECFAIAQELKTLWFETWPEMVAYFEYIKQQTGRQKITVETDDGFEEISIGSITHVISNRVRGRCSFTNGANSLFQGLGADIAKRALWLVSKEMHCDPTSPLWGSHIVVFVHDEIISEHPEEKAHDAAFRVAELMAKAFHEFCPTLPCEVRPALMRRWYKGAEEEYRDGVLVPWEPKISA